MVFRISDSRRDYPSGCFQFSEVVSSSAGELALLVEIFLGLLVFELIQVVLVTKFHLFLFLLFVEAEFFHPYFNFVFENLFLIFLFGFDLLDHLFLLFFFLFLVLLFFLVLELESLNFYFLSLVETILYVKVTYAA